MITNPQRTSAGAATPQRPVSAPPREGRIWSRREDSTKPKQSRAGFFFVIVALVLATIASVTANLVLTHIAVTGDKIKQPTVIATQKIPVGTAITPAMFTITQVPVNYRPNTAAQSDSQVVGRIAFFTIPSGVPITMDALSDVGAPESVAGQLPKSGVGFFLPDSALVEPVPLTLVNPGDYVDLYVAGFPSRSTPTDPNPSLNPVISCVPVLDLVGAGQNVPQNIVNASSANATSSPGFVMVMTSSQVSAVLYFVQTGGKLAVVIDRYDACKA